MNHNYFSIWNRYGVSDIESLLPVLNILESEMDAKYATIRTNRQVELALMESLYNSESKIAKALIDFVRISEERFQYRTMSEAPTTRAMRAVVALNNLYDAIKSEEGIEKTLLQMYRAGHFVEFRRYVRDLHNYENARTLSIGSVMNVSSQYSGNSNMINRSNMNNLEGAFGPMNGGKKRFTKRVRSKRRITRR